MSAKSRQFMARPKRDLCNDPNQELISVGTGINSGEKRPARTNVDRLQISTQHLYLILRYQQLQVLVKIGINSMVICSRG